MKRCEGHDLITGEICEGWGTLGFGVRDWWRNQPKAKLFPSMWVCPAHEALGQTYHAKVNAE